jgi:hypothetical protein
MGRVGGSGKVRKGVGKWGSNDRGSYMATKGRHDIQYMVGITGRSTSIMDKG